MTRRRGRLLLVLALLVGVAGIDAGTDAARAADATIVEVGWWSRTPSPTAPEGGFQVARNVDGETSVSALRIQYEGPLTNALLVLVEATTGYLEEGAVVEACPTSAPWTATVAGPLAEAPAGDCTTKITLARDAVTGAWTADVTALLTGDRGTVALVLRPGTATTVTPPAPPSVPSPVPLVPLPSAPPVPLPPVSTPVDPGFAVDFVRGSLQVTGEAEPFDDGGSSADFGSGGIASDLGSASGSSTFAPTFVPTDSFATSAGASLTPSASGLPAATREVTTGGAGGAGTAASVESGLQPVAATTGPATPWGRLFLLLPLSAMVGAAGAFARRSFLGTRPALP